MSSMKEVFSSAKNPVVWLWRVLKKGFLLLGVLPQLLDYVSTYIPSQYIPSYVRDFLEKGGDWRLTSFLVGIGFLVSAFLVHLDTQRELRELEIRVRELEDQKPRITVGFQDETGHLTKTLRIQLRPLPPKPDLNALVEKKRECLLKKWRDRHSAPNTIASIIESVNRGPNPHYEEDVEEYLPKYRSYLIRRYEQRVANDRTRSVVPVVQNEGHYPATDVTIEFTMPEAYREPARHQHPVPITGEIAQEFGLTKEELLELEVQDLCELPPEPQPSVSLVPPVPYSMLRPSSVDHIQEVSNTSGPFHDIRDGVHYIAYSIEKLIQHRPEYGFEPFHIWLGEIEHCVTWEIPVRITSATLQEPEEDVLHVEIEIVEDAKAPSGVG